MALDMAAMQAIELEKLPRSPNLRVESIEVQPLTDWTGDDALRVTVFLEEDVDIEKVTGQEVSDLKWSIRDQLRSHGIELFAYIFLTRRSAEAETDEE